MKQISILCRKKMDRLKNKIAIVTGAAHGIGQAIAECFAEEGAWVLVADLDEEAGEETAERICERGGQALFFPCDVGNPEHVKKAVHQAAVETGRIDILCNNAAYINQWHDVLNAPDEEWERCFNVSLLGSANFIKGVLPFMLKQESGSIINISSVHGLGSTSNAAPYSSIKHGIIGLTRSVANDYGLKNVRCNAICPGTVQVRYSPQPGDEKHKREVARTMMGRLGQPREIGMAAVFLASDEASYVTGAVLPVDGGWTAF